MGGRKTTPEKPPTRRELSIAGRELGKSSTSKADRSLAGRVLSEDAATRRGSASKRR
jgi:hypothetical protein